MKVVLNFDEKFAKKYSEYDLKMYAAVGLYQNRIMSTGDLAKAVGISRLDFIEDMGKYGSGILDMTQDELEMEINNAKKLL